MKNVHAQLAALSTGDVNSKDAFVVLRLTGPANKVFELDDAGKVIKTPAANASRYLGMQITVPDQETMVEVLRAVGDDPQACLVHGRFKDAKPGLFSVLSKKAMAEAGGAKDGWSVVDEMPAIQRAKTNMLPGIVRRISVEAGRVVS